MRTSAGPLRKGRLENSRSRARHIFHDIAAAERNVPGGGCRPAGEAIAAEILALVEPLALDPGKDGRPVTAE